MAEVATLPFPKPVSTSGRLPALDGIRGLAVLLVFLGHTSSRGMVPADWLNFDHLGVLGVYLFFVLSGYLLALHYREGQSLPEYFLRRIFRILPLYYLVLSLTVVSQQFIETEGYLHVSGGAASYLRHFLLLDGHGVFWSIPTEFAFYLLLPAVIWSIHQYGIGPAVAFALFYFGYVQLTLYSAHEFPVANFLYVKHPTQFLDVFIIGTLSTYVAWPKTGSKTAWCTLFLFGFWIAVMAERFLGLRMPLGDIRLCSLPIAMSSALLVLGTARENAFLEAIFRARLLRFLGKVGFSWYLLHMPVIQAVNAWGPANPHFRLVAAFLICCIVSWIAFYAVEEPGLRLGKTVIKRLGIRPNRPVGTVSVRPAA